MKILAPIKSNQESARLPRIVEKATVPVLAAVCVMGSARTYAGINVWTGGGPEGLGVGSPVIDVNSLNRCDSHHNYCDWASFFVLS